MLGRKRFKAKEYVEYRKHIQEQMDKGKLKVPVTKLTDAEKAMVLYGN